MGVDDTAIDAHRQHLAMSAGGAFAGWAFTFGFGAEVGGGWVAVGELCYSILIAVMVCVI